MSLNAVINPSTAAATNVALNPDGYSHIMVFAVGLTGAETVEVFIVGGQGAVPYAVEQLAVQLSATQPFARLPAGPSYAVDKSASAGNVAVYWSGASSSDALTQAGAGGGGGGAFDPASLFASGEVGVWYDPSDFSTMFQDTAGTVPVTATGQAVARINDKSGRGNNATQATGANCPLLQQDGSGKYYLAFDGVNDVISCSGATFTASMYVCMGAQRSGGCVTLVAVPGAGSRFTLVANAADGASMSAGAGTPAAYVNGVISTGATRGQLATDWPTSTNAVLESYPTDMVAVVWGGLAFGFYSGFAGFRRMYGMIVVENPASDARDSVRGYIANKSGVFF